MPRARLISPEFWTSEAVVDCAPMTRLLLIGLSNFADDFGVQPLRPRTLRMQVFPGDAVDDDQLRAMIEELAAHGLVRRYTVSDVEYVEVVDWAVHQRVAKRARRRYPAPGEDAKLPDHSKPEQSVPAALVAPSSEAADAEADAAWRDTVEHALRRAWGADIPGDVARHAARWRAQGRDLKREVLPAIERVVYGAVEFNRPLVLQLVDGAMGPRLAA